MAAADWPYLELLDIGRLIRSREVSSVEVTRAQLERIGRLDGRLKSYVTVMADSAQAEAERADGEIAAGAVRGPLHGVPLAVKDLCWTRGVPTAAGMAIHRDFRPAEDATVVRRLREAGAVLLGKLQLTEGAYIEYAPGVTPPVNPWNEAYWAGASSSGPGVATAAGLCYGSLGSDTGGSIRCPSAVNGCTGIKPTWGRVSRHGVFELAATLDHIGPMARSAADAAALLGVLAGADPQDPTASHAPVPDYLAAMTGGLRGLRIGVDPDWNARQVEAPVAAMLAAVMQVVTDLGGELRQVAFPDPEAVIADWFPLCGIEAAVAHEKTYPARRDEYGPGLAGIIELGRAQSALDYQRIVLRRQDFRGRLAALFTEVDLLLLPALGVSAPTLARMEGIGEDADLISGLLRYTCPFDMSGSPTLTLPGGFTAEGTPEAFQFAARDFGEDLLVRAGWAFQQATDWHRRHPPL